MTEPATATARGRERLPAWARREIRISRHGAALGLVLLLALYLRVDMVWRSHVVMPVHADAADYVLYAHNLERFGVYSRGNTLPSDAEAPIPDSARVPLYPLFLTLFLDRSPRMTNLPPILLAQALIGTLTVLLTYFLGRVILPRSLAVAAALLAALSPHLVTMSIYLLTETLLALTVVAGVLAAVKWLRSGNSLATLSIGVLLALPALTHPMMQYFVLALCAYVLLAPAVVPTRASRLRTAAVLTLGFALAYGPWVVRNLVTLGTAGDRMLMLASLRAGAYTDLMYQDRPETFAYPYGADPEFAETIKSPSATLAAVVQSFIDRPLTQLRWYLVGKPLLLYSWANVEGTGDLYMYQTIFSPYETQPVFRCTYWLMRSTHTLWVLLMACGVVVAWLPLGITRLPPGAADAARVVSVLLAYHLAVMVAGFPLPRYSIAMRPFLYILAMIPIALVVSRWRHRTHHVG